MTNSPATAIRQRRIQPARGWFLLGIVLVVAATIPLSVMHQAGSLNFDGFPKLFQQPAEKKISTADLNTLKKKISAPSSLGANSKDSAAYVQALDRAASKLSADINKSPSDPALQNRLGLIYLTLGDFKSAEQCFTNAVSLSRGAINNYSNEVEKLKRAGKMSDASNLVLEASKSSVELSAAHSNLARVYDQRGDREAVIAELDQINKDGMLFSGFAAGGGTLKSKDSIMSTQDAQRLAEAEALFKSNQFAAALTSYKKVAADNPKLSFVFDRIGLISVMTGDLSAGVDAWEQAAKLDPKAAPIRSNLGLAYHQLGMDNESEESFRKALAIDPGMEEAALNLGDLLAARSELGQAISVMTVAAKHNPKSARIDNNLGTFLSMNGKYAEAITAFHAALRLDPNMASAHYGIGVALMKSHKYIPAIRELKIALALNPKLTEAQTHIEEAKRIAGIRG